MHHKSVGVLFFFIVFAEVAPWTIDLPEVRKYFFAKHEKELEISKNEYEDYANRDKIFYSNAQDNQLHKEKEKYAAEFGYHSYMEKKVEEIVHDGSAYLEGLRRSLENFNRFLVQCNSSNISLPQTPEIFNSTQSASSSNVSEKAGALITSGFNDTFEMNSTRMGSSSPRAGMSCRQASEVSERVRRYAALATWATQRLQDLTYADKYQDTDKYEENELILKLAWFLDQLASLTGYEPEHERYLTQETTATPTTSIEPSTMVPQSQELINSLMECMKEKSTVPATIRCQYTLTLPETVQQIVGGTSTRAPEVTSEMVPTPSSENNPQQSMELLIAADDFRNPRRLSKRSPDPDEYYVPIPVHEKPKPIVDFIVKKLTNLKEIVKTVKKHAVADFASQVAIHKHIHKRSIDNNSSTLINILSNSSKPIVKSDGTAVKSDETNVNSDGTNVKSDGTAVKSDEIVFKDVLQHLPIPDISIINTKSFKKRSIDKTSNLNLLNKLSNYKSIAKSIKSSVKSVKKRSIDDPFGTLANYYIKYKVWDSLNPSQDKKTKPQTNFDANNNLQTKIVAKRSLFQKKNRHLLLKPITEKPKKILPKKQKGIAMTKLLEKKHKKVGKKLHKVSRRSLYYDHMYLPRIPFNPMGDISYYVKNKEDHNYMPSLTQAAQVRLGLQQVFETGNIEVVRRYGANYNPANPAPLYTGILKGMADS